MVLCLGAAGCDATPTPPPPMVRPQGYLRCEGARAGTFCDVTAQWGLSGEVVLPGDSRDAEEGIGGAVTSADFDGDGRFDLLAVWDGAPPSLWLNTPGGFVERAGAWGLGTAAREINAASAADLDGDGDADLLVHERRIPGIQLLRNDGGRFAPAAVLGDDQDFTALVPADIDGDGRLDITVGATARPGDCPRLFISGCPAGVRAWRQSAPWVFTAIPVDAAPRRALAIRWHDLERDGRDELLVIADFGMLNGGNQVLRVEGAGDAMRLREQPVQGFDVEIFGMGVAPIDVDRDGRDELIVTNFGRNALLRERGGRWEDVAVALGADAYGFYDPDARHRWVDYDPAHPWMGPMDVFQSRYLDRDGPLCPSTKWTPLVFDYDHDGIDDVYIGAAATGLTSLFPEPARQAGAMLRGDGARLHDVTEALRLGELHGAFHPVAVDLDGDGDLDLALPRSAYPGRPGGLVVLRNDARAGNALWVEARGLGGARDGIGATVRVTVGGRTVTRRLDGNHSIAGSGPHGVHVGLGAATRAERVEVRFVSGAVRRLTEVPAGRVRVDE